MTDQFWIFPFAVVVFIVSGLVILRTRLGKWVWSSTLAAVALFVWSISTTDRAPPLKLRY
jgi:hypothetical protein